MNIAICDDNNQDTAQICHFLRDHLNKNGYLGELHTFNKGEDLIAAFSSHTYDAVFLDIYMSGLNGIETARKLREINPDFALVFITISQDHAIEAFSQRAIAYVPKPIRQADIDNAFLQCRSVFLKNARFIEIITDRNKVKIPLIKIIFIETYGRETIFHTTAREIKTTAPLLLNHLDQELGNSFLRCNRSYIINMNHVKTMLADNFQMKDGSLVPIRQRGRSKIRSIYATFISAQLFEVSS